jgi:hypothetical protein
MVRHYVSHVTHNSFVLVIQTIRFLYVLIMLSEI